MFILHLSITALILEDSWIPFGNTEQQLLWPKSVVTELEKSILKIPSSWIPSDQYINSKWLL